MKLRVCILGFAIPILFVPCASAWIIEGNVYDSQTKEVLDFVRVIVVGRAIDTTTDSNGYFSIEIDEEDVKLHFQKKDYEVGRRTIVRGETNLPIEVSLSKMRDIVEELVNMSLSTLDEYMSLHNRIKELAKERGKEPEELKDEIDKWFETVKTPYEKGLAALYRQEYQEAEDYLNESIESSKQELAKKYYHRGNAQLANRKYDLAIASYKVTLSINPNHDKAHNNMGIAYSSMGEYDLAIESCKTAICINPNLAQAHHNMGVAYYSMGKYDPAIDAYKEAINIVPNARSHNNLGNIYARQHKYDLAIASYKEATCVDPNDAGVYYNLAVVYSLKNEKGLSIESLQKAVALNRIYLEVAKADSSFNNIRGSPEFQLLVK